MHMKRITKRRTLKAWRGGRSQADAAEMLGMSQPHYSRLERGTHVTTGPNAKRISDKTGVPIAVLVGAV